MASTHWRVETWINSKKNRKYFSFSKMSKSVPNSVQTCYEVIFWNHHALQGRKLEQNQNKIEVLEFQKCPKTFLKVSKHVLNLFWGNFLGKKVPSAPRNVKTWNNFKKLEKLSHFENSQKRSQKQSNTFWTCFEEIFPIKLFLSAPWGFERREDGKYGKFQYI